jgi:hypothetical protein
MDFLKKIKTEYYIIFIIILVALASFGMGRMSALEGREEEGVEFMVPELAQINMDFRNYGYFASVNGARYYPMGCNAGNRINMENRMYFKTAQDAIKSGFSKAVNC